MDRLSQRELADTRADLRRWSQQLLEISGELTAMVDDLTNGNGGDEDGNHRAGQPEGHRPGGR